MVTPTKGLSVLAGLALSLFVVACGDTNVTEATPDLDAPALDLVGDYTAKVLEFEVPPVATQLTLAPNQPSPRTVAVCHKYGTPAQKTLVLPPESAAWHVAAHGDFYGTCGATYIDVDGTVSAGDGVPAAIDVTLGDALTPWPTGIYVEGVDWFDNDGSCTWTMGDDLHAEGPAHPSALRDAVHQNSGAFSDPVVLDLDGSLFHGQRVTHDLETGSTFVGCPPGLDPLMKFFDANGNGFWDDGEDIVLDLDNDGIFN